MNTFGTQELRSDENVPRPEPCEEEHLTPEYDLESLIDNDKDGVILVDSHHRILRINKVISNASGYEEEQIKGKPLDDLISPESLPRVSTLIDRSLRGLSTEPMEFGPPRNDGEPCITVHVNALKKRGEIIGAAITTRKMPGGEQRPEVKGPGDGRFRNIIENTSDWIWEVDSKYIYTYANPRVETILGYQPQEVVGKTIFDFLPLKEASRVAKRFESAKSLKQPLRLIQIPHLHKNGGSITLETTAVPIFDGSGSVGGYHGIHRDITGREKSEQQFAESMIRIERSLDGIVEAMTLAVEARDHYSVGHQQRVAKLASAIAWEMGDSLELGHAVRTAGLLHDVGKIFIPTEMLTKPGRLTEDELVTIRSHPKAGYEILKKIDFPWPIAEIVLQHHERMNGSGYPSGLSGDEIRLEARILGVADSIEAMVHPRSYRPALGADQALRQVAANKGVLYDGKVVEACLSIFLDKGFKFESQQDNSVGL